MADEQQKERTAAHARREERMSARTPWLSCAQHQRGGGAGRRLTSRAQLARKREGRRAERPFDAWDSNARRFEQRRR
jgi:hypothetical protein